LIAILEYLHSNSTNIFVSKYHIMTKVPEQQRQDRISLVLPTLEKNELIKSTDTSNATFYRIIDKGGITYLKEMGDFEFKQIRN
jgi:hypothetical protein